MKSEGRSFIFIDLETTDLLRPMLSSLFLQPHITEITAIKLDKDLNIIDEYNTLMKPPIPIPPHITKITKITDEMVANKRPFVQEYKNIAKFFTGVSDVVGHNISFDLDVIRVELMRIGKEFQFPWPMRRHCTIELSYHLNNRRMKLGELYKLATGKEIVDAHRSRSDVMATIECYKWMKKKGML